MGRWGRAKIRNICQNVDAVETWELRQVMMQGPWDSRWIARSSRRYTGGNIWNKQNSQLHIAGRSIVNKLNRENWVMTVQNILPTFPVYWVKTIVLKRVFVYLGINLIAGTWSTILFLCLYLCLWRRLIRYFNHFSNNDAVTDLLWSIRNHIYLYFFSYITRRSACAVLLFSLCT